MQVLENYSWKGNIKELKNICFQIAILHSDKEIITESEVEKLIQVEAPSLLNILHYDPQLSLEKLVNYYIQLSLDHFHCKKESAKALGISVKTIYNKIQKGSVYLYE